MLARFFATATGQLKYTGTLSLKIPPSFARSYTHFSLLGPVSSAYSGDTWSHYNATGRYHNTHTHTEDQSMY